MSVARILCRAQVGLIAPRVDVEVHLGAGLRCFNIVGLPATEVKESKERVRAALANSGFEFPTARITINLAPAELPKDGGRFDFAITIGVSVASEQVSSRLALDTLEFYGERGLSGDRRPIRGALPAAAAATADGHRVVLPFGNHHELTWCPNLEAVIADSLRSVGEKLVAKEIHRSAISASPSNSSSTAFCGDSAIEGLRLSEVYGQPRGKRALELTNAGGYSLFMVGPPDMERPCSRSDCHGYCRRSPATRPSKSR